MNKLVYIKICYAIKAFALNIFPISEFLVCENIYNATA